MFSLESCYESVKNSVELYNDNVFELLGRYTIRATQDPFFNKTMIDACIKYINDNNIEWNDK